MKKKLLSFLLAAIMVVTLLPATAWATATPIDESSVTWELTNDNTVLTIGGTGAMPDYDTSKLSSRPWHASQGTITTVIIESGVTKIGDNAFWNFTSLTNVSISSSVQTIGDSAFQGCTALEGVEIPSSVTSIGANTFSNCSKLASVTIPSGVKSIGKNAFISCRELKNVTFASGSELTTLGSGAFSGCNKLTSVEIPSGVTTIEQSTFNNCSGLTSVTIPSGVTTIGGSAFSSCSKLTSVTIPSGVTSIGESVFSRCSELTSVTIPSGVTTIGKRVFYLCSNLASVIVKAENPPTLGTDPFTGANSCEIYVQEASVNTYKAADGWSAYADKIAGYSADAQIHDDIVFEPWIASEHEGKLLPDTAGSWYLDEEVTLTETWTVPTGTTNLCLNGNVIDANGGKFSVITVSSGATLNLYDCNYTQTHKFKVGSDGLWTFDEGNNRPATPFESLTAAPAADDCIQVTGGCITGGNSPFYGGVHVNGGMFNMSGGSIVGNTANSGGGVYVGGGTFNMSGGNIVGNLASSTIKGGDGGGVYSAGSFNMFGGSIVYNMATTNGGGVGMNNNSTTLGGTAKIIDNFKETGGSKTANNIYLNGNTITLGTGDNVPASGMNVGVTMASAPGAFTTEAETTDRSHIKYFFSDSDSYYVTTGENVLQLAAVGENYAVLNVADGDVYENLQQAIYAATSGTTLKLLKDVTGNGTVNKPLTLDLNGHVLSGTGDGSVITVESDRSLTLIDSNPTTEHAGYVDADGLWHWDEKSEHQLGENETAKTIKGGIITGGTGTMNSSILVGGGVYVCAGSFTMTGGTIAGNSAVRGGGVILLGNQTSLTTFTMEGGSISYNTAKNDGGGVNANDYSEFIMKGGNIDNNRAENGGGVLIIKGGTLDMSGGNIVGNEAGNQGGGVNINDGGSFTMQSGNIVGNTAAKAGGGVYVIDGDTRGSFTMKGGLISCNRASDNNGGGVCAAGDFTMEGGSIKYNSTDKSGGGVRVAGNGVFTMTAGEISDNTAVGTGGGVDVGGTITLGGTAKITGSVKGGTITNGELTGGTANNLYLPDGKTVTLGTGNGEGKNGVAVPVTEGDTTMSVGVTMQTAGVFTGANEANYSALFTADTGADYQVTNLTNDSNKLKLMTKYDVTVADGIQNGAVTTNAANNKAFEGDIVTITATPSSSYKLTTDSLIVFPSKCAKCGESVTSAKCDQCGEEFDPLELDQNQNGTYTFTMPAYAVTVSAEFEPVPAPVHHGGSASSNAVELPENVDNGKLDVSPKNASAGQTVTVTVTPDKGFTLETITVLDKNGKEVEVKNLGNGKFSFEMPNGKVSISATFMEDNSMLNFFVDVPANEYYYDAVKWAAENGITDGVDATHFAPNMGTTRAQVVTFLWRAAGCPVVNYSMNFEDIPEGTWYTEAVRWAASEMITDGTSATTFSPDRICTRGQIVTFIARFAGVKDKATGYSHDFTDVSAANYYNNAVAWAYENEITEGTSATTFSPDKDCTRAQIVTFLYRHFVK